MRKYVFLFLAVISLVAFSQIKSVFPSDKATWSLYYYNDGWLHAHVIYTACLTASDSILNDKRYGILDFSYYSLNPDSTVVGLASVGDKVWITYDWKQEYLLYDFGANIGDTIWHGTILKDFPYGKENYVSMYPENDEYYSVIEAIEDTPEGRRFFTQINVRCTRGDDFYEYPWDRDSWIEGVGSEQGLVGSWVMGGPIPVCLECPISSFTLSWALYDTNYAYPQFATGKEGDVAITYDKEKDSLYVVLADHIMGYSPYCLSVYPAVSDPIQQGANCISMIPLNKKRNSVSLKNLSDGTYVVGYDWRWGAFTPSFLFVKTSLQAIEKVQESACSVYQDGGYLHLSRRDASAEKIQVHLYDQMGRLLWSDVFLDSYSVPLFSFQRGIYFLQMDGQVSKFAVE